MILDLIRIHPAPGQSIIPILWFLILLPGIAFKILDLVTALRRREAARGNRLLELIAAEGTFSVVWTLILQFVAFLMGLGLLYLDMIGGLDFQFASVAAYIGFFAVCYGAVLALSAYAFGNWVLHWAQHRQQQREDKQK